MGRLAVLGATIASLLCPYAGNAQQYTALPEAPSASARLADETCALWTTIVAVQTDTARARPDAQPNLRLVNAVLRVDSVMSRPDTRSRWHRDPAGEQEWERHYQLLLDDDAPFHPSNVLISRDALERIQHSINRAPGSLYVFTCAEPRRLRYSGATRVRFLALPGYDG